MPCLQSWPIAVKSIAAVHRGLEVTCFDNGNEFTNADLRRLFEELGVALEYTPVDGTKRNGHAERMLMLIAGGARAARLEVSNHFPDLNIPAKADS